MKKNEIEQSRKGKEFTAANGGKIKNEGEKMIPFRTRENEDKTVRAQIVDVTRMLKMTKVGYKAHLDVESFWHPEREDEEDDEVTAQKWNLLIGHVG